MGTFVSISGGGSANVHIYGNGSVAAGNGNDTIQIDGNGRVTVGSGHDVLTLNGQHGYILQNGAGGNDTINLGSGQDSITEAGTATVHGAFGSATVQGGKFQFYGKGTTANPWKELAIDGKATLVGGGCHPTEFIAGSGSVVMQGSMGNDTFIGGSGLSTMTGGTGHNLFEVVGRGGIGGTDVITNFVSGHDQLFLEAHSYDWLMSHGDITVSHGNTYISLDGGQTTVELKGFTGLTSGDVTTHKG